MGMAGRTKRRTSREKKIWRRNTALIPEGERRKQEIREKVRTIEAVLKGSNDVVDFVDWWFGVFLSVTKYNYLLKILSVGYILFLTVL